MPRVGKCSKRFIIEEVFRKLYFNKCQVRSLQALSFFLILLGCGPIHFPKLTGGVNAENRDWTSEYQIPLQSRSLRNITINIPAKTVSVLVFSLCVFSLSAVRVTISRLPREHVCLFFQFRFQNRGKFSNGNCHFEIT